MSFEVGKVLAGGAAPWYKAIGYGLRALIILILIALIVSGGLSIWRAIFPAPEKQINNPKVVALPGSKIDKIDQSNVQVLLEEKTWAVNLGGGALNYDGRNGYFIGGWVTKKF